MKLIKLATIALILTTVAGCGFRLRGTVVIPDYLKIVYITPNDPYESFQRELRYRLKKYKVQIVADRESARSTLEISKPIIVSQPLAYSSSDQVQRYKLIYTVNYRFTAKGTDHVGEPHSIVRTREISKTNNLLLTNESEEKIVQKELLTEAVTELLRQITSRPLHKESTLDSSTTDNNPC